MSLFDAARGGRALAEEARRLEEAPGALRTRRHHASWDGGNEWMEDPLMDLVLYFLASCLEVHILQRENKGGRGCFVNRRDRWQPGQKARRKTFQRRSTRPQRCKR